MSVCKKDSEVWKTGKGKEEEKKKHLNQGQDDVT